MIVLLQGDGRRQHFVFRAAAAAAAAAAHDVVGTGLAEVSVILHYSGLETWENLNPACCPCCIA